MLQPIGSPVPLLRQHFARDPHEHLNDDRPQFLKDALRDLFLNVVEAHLSAQGVRPHYDASPAERLGHRARVNRVVVPFLREDLTVFRRDSFADGQPRSAHRSPKYAALSHRSIHLAMSSGCCRTFIASPSETSTRAPLPSARTLRTCAGLTHTVCPSVSVSTSTTRMLV